MPSLIRCLFYIDMWQLTQVKIKWYYSRTRDVVTDSADGSSRKQRSESARYRGGASRRSSGAEQEPAASALSSTSRRSSGATEQSGRSGPDSERAEGGDEEEEAREDV